MKKHLVYSVDVVSVFQSISNLYSANLFGREHSNAIDKRSI